jgi:predicted nucleotide-binding protein
MVKISPKLEILYNDLRYHGIGEFLTSRNFKVFMIEKGLYDQWKEVFENVKKNRTYFSLSFDHDIGDSETTLSLYLNAIERDKNAIPIVAWIIAKFIEFKDVQTDFNDIIESLRISGLNEANINFIAKTIEEHNQKTFPKKKVLAKKELTTQNTQLKKQVFIVHGHNQEVMHNLARVIGKLGLEPIILNEQSNEGQTIIEKFEKHANVSYAVVLLTYDDFGNSKIEKVKKKRARQNVILELGYFLSKLGRKNVLPLYEEGVELPSDISGVLYTMIDKAGHWKIKLVQELKAAGFEVDANKII